MHVVDEISIRLQNHDQPETGLEREKLTSVAAGRCFDAFHSLSTMNFSRCGPGGSEIKAENSFPLSTRQAVSTS